MHPLSPEYSAMMEEINVDLRACLRTPDIVWTNPKPLIAAELMLNDQAKFLIEQLSALLTARRKALEAALARL